ncbi:hypothetical protein [Mucilaginibacter sp.]|uniref:hypothetical protein n=1 Tax=Mucilaginibacter sp. TaxID=1882438 RepID=UPI003262DF31
MKINKKKSRDNQYLVFGVAFGPTGRQAGRAIYCNSSIRAADRSGTPFRGFRFYLTHLLTMIYLIEGSMGFQNNDDRSGSLSMKCFAYRSNRF